MSNNLHAILPVVLFVLLIIWSMYRRIRRTVGLQRLEPRRLRVRAVLFVIIAVLFATSAFTSALSAAMDVAGVLIGGLLVYAAIRTTKFEERGNVIYYRHNLWLGLILVALLAGRIGFRFIYLFLNFSSLEAGQKAALTGSHTQLSGYTSDPYLTGLFYVVFVYYIGYYFWLLWRYKKIAVATDSQ